MNKDVICYGNGNAYDDAYDDEDADAYDDAYDDEDADAYVDAYDVGHGNGDGNGNAGCDVYKMFPEKNQVHFFHLKVIKIFTVPKVKRLKASLVVLRNNVLDGLRWGVEWCLNTGHLESGLLMNIMI